MSAASAAGWYGGARLYPPPPLANCGYLIIRMSRDVIALPILLAQGSYSEGAVFPWSVAAWR
jgi:hypothetical protein